MEMNWDYALNAFKEKQNAVYQHSRATINSYDKNLQSLKIYMQSIGINDPSNVSKNDMDTYIAILSRNFENTSVNQKITTFRQFFMDFNLIVNKSENPMSGIASLKHLDHLPIFLSESEIKAFLDIKLENENDILHKAIFEIMYCGGLRVSEVCDLELINLHLSQNIIKFIGKGNKERLVVLHDQAINALNYYLNGPRLLYTKKKANKLVFVNKNNARISREYIYRIVKKRALELGLNPNISPHSLRHSFASHMLEEGSNLIVIQELLGHSDIKTTQIYTHINPKKLHDNYDNYFPKSKGKKE